MRALILLSGACAELFVRVWSYQMAIGISTYLGSPSVET